jgi:hypothetical protein
MASGVEAVSDALAAGTFLYVGALDVVEKVLAKRERRWL